jgi:hypothetical protein
MTDEVKNPTNRVELDFDGKFVAFWRGQVVYESGRVKVKKFETERDAWQYLTHCDTAGSGQA